MFKGARPLGVVSLSLLESTNKPKKRLATRASLSPLSERRLLNYSDSLGLP